MRIKKGYIYKVIKDMFSNVNKSNNQRWDKELLFNTNLIIFKMRGTLCILITTPLI